MNKYAPVVVFTYSRLDHLKKTIEALQANLHAQDTVLYVVSDGPAVQDHVGDIRRLRDYVDGINGFQEVVRIYRDRNLGPLHSPILAEQAIVNDHGCVISLEDDNITSRNFLAFMNQGLEAFKCDESVYSIGAYIPACINPNHEDQADFWFYPWNISWGYAVHKHQYNKFHPLVNRYPLHKSSGLLRQQNKAGGLYVSDSLRRDYKRQKNLADSILCTEMFSRGMRTVLPTVAKVRNIGQDGSGQSTSNSTGKYESILDNANKFDFNFNSESPCCQLYKKTLSQFYNGRLLTRLTRYFCIYHAAEMMRRKFL